MTLGDSAEQAAAPPPEIWLLRLPALAEADEQLRFRGRFVSLDCLVGTAAVPVYLTIAHGRVADAQRGPLLMRPWRFAIRATPRAWNAFWQPVPRPGWHDLFALAKRGEATIEGEIGPLLANLQFFKDLLALPRGRAQEWPPVQEGAA